MGKEGEEASAGLQEEEHGGCRSENAMGCGGRRRCGEATREGNERVWVRVGSKWMGVGRWEGIFGNSGSFVTYPDLHYDR